MPEYVVVDTSVIVSALISASGSSREVMRLGLTGEFQPLISNALFHEYEAVSSREEVIELCPVSEAEIGALLSAWYSVCLWVPIYYLWRPNLIDEGDNFLVELALAGGARTIVSGNVRDLKNAELEFPELAALTPAQFLRGV